MTHRHSRIFHINSLEYLPKRKTLSQLENVGPCKRMKERDKHRYGYKREWYRIPGLFPRQKAGEEISCSEYQIRVLFTQIRALIFSAPTNRSVGESLKVACAALGSSMLDLQFGFKKTEFDIE